MTTTTKLGDYLGRALTNHNPGTSNATDFLGRNVTASNKDFNGVALTDNPQYPPPDWASGTAYSLGTRRKVPGTNEVQTVEITGTPEGGTYKLAVDGVETAALNHNHNAAALQTALVNLSNVNPGDVTVTGTNPFTLTWQSELGNVPEVTLADNSLTGGTDPDVDIGTTTQGATLGAILEVTVAGTSHSSKPTAPAVGATVTDNTVTWRRLK
jgi:hypothetical protein